MAAACCEREYWDDEVGKTWGFFWRSKDTGELLDLTAHSFRLDILQPSDEIVTSKTLGLVGGNGGVDGTDPNFVVTWLAGDFTGLEGWYSLAATDLAAGGVTWYPSQYPRMRIRPRPT
jgi:hypothetical protein